jgi:hypothetical protein
MAGTTTYAQFPYPTSTDMPDGPAQIKALAEAVEDRVPVNYTNAAQRDTALGANPPVGTIAFLVDLKIWTGYDGTAWRALSATNSTLGAWTAFTPTFTATTNPTLGNFIRSGRYIVLGKTIHWSVVITCNSASGLGTGNYQIGLPPVAARDPDHVVIYAAQNLPNRTYLGRMPDGNSHYLIATDTMQAVDLVRSGMANGTIVRINGTYEAA